MEPECRPNSRPAPRRDAPTPSAPPEAAAARFADDLDRVAQSLSAADRIGLAVSGGPDSLALLLLAHRAFPGRIEAATVDHGLRPEAADEARFVAALCAELAVPHAILNADGLPPGNVSAAARHRRYELLGSWAAARSLAWIATAHHADDQLETMVMRLNRGAGVSGLAGIRARSGPIVRPLLSWRQDELAAIVQHCGVVAVDDPSNRDDRYDRARLRKVLGSADWLNAEAAAQSAAALAEAETAIEWSVDLIERQAVTECDGAMSFERQGFDYPPEYLRRIVLRCLLRVDPACAPRGGALTRLIGALEQGGVATIGDVLCRGGDSWLFGSAPPRRRRG